MAPKKSVGSLISRRNFLALSGAVPAVVLAHSLSETASAAPASGEAVPTPVKKYPIGLELYSVRGQLMADLPLTLRTVSKMGYDVVEFYAPYYDWKFPYCKYVRNLVDDLGLRCYSTHNHIDLMEQEGSRFSEFETARRCLDSWKKMRGEV